MHLNKAVLYPFFPFICCYDGTEVHYCCQSSSHYIMTEVRWERDNMFAIRQHLCTKVGFVPGFGCGKAGSHYREN